MEKNFEEESIPLVSTISEQKGFDTGIGSVPEEEQDFLSNIISNLNDSFGIDFSDDDKVNLRRMFSIYKDNEEYKKGRVREDRLNSKVIVKNKRLEIIEYDSDQITFVD